MVAALPLLSLAAGAGTATAGATTAGTLFGVTAGTLATVSAGAGAVSSIFSGLSANSESDFQASQVELQAQADRTEAAEEEFNRQKRLRAILATQNAAFSASGGFGGSQNAIQLADIGEANRQQGQSDLLGDINAAQSDLQIKQFKKAGNAKLLQSLSSAGTLLGKV